VSFEAQFLQVVVEANAYTSVRTSIRETALLFRRIHNGAVPANQTPIVFGCWHLLL